jgi:ParB-like chromosome segregation protein Spo0J
MEIKLTSLDLIKPYWRNPRKNEAAVAAVMESIRLYGMNVPIVVDTDMVILTGHTRYKALRRLNATQAPVIVVNVDEANARRFRIADNKAHEFSEWNLDLLKDELTSMLEDAESKANFGKVFGDADWREMLSLSSLLPDADEMNAPLPPGVGSKISGQEIKPAEQVDAPDETVTLICPHCLADNVVKKKDFDQEQPEG